MRFCLKGQCNFCHENVIILIKIPYVEDGNIFRKYLQFEEKSFVGRQNIMLCQEKIHVWKWESPCCSPQFILMSRENSSLSENILVLALSLHYLNITQLPQILHQPFSLLSWRRPRTSWSACVLYRSWRVGSKSLIVSLEATHGCPASKRISRSNKDLASSFRESGTVHNMWDRCDGQVHGRPSHG